MKQYGPLYVGTLKKRVICTDAQLENFNWNLLLPLDYSTAPKEHVVPFDKKKIDDKTLFKKDIRAPVAELTFRLEGGDAKLGADEAVRVEFSKVKLQEFFEELEKIQSKIDELAQ